MKKIFCLTSLNTYNLFQILYISIFPFSSLEFPLTCTHLLFLTSTHASSSDVQLLMFQWPSNLYSTVRPFWFIHNKFPATWRHKACHYPCSYTPKCLWVRSPKPQMVISLSLALYERFFKNNHVRFLISKFESQEQNKPRLVSWALI